MEVSSLLQAPADLLPEKDPEMPIVLETGWVPEAVWTLWSRDMFHALAENQTPAAQSAARLYTNWTISALLFIRASF
jgi:hypothetical protein